MREDDEATTTGPAPGPPSGETDGWRWWWADDGGERWLAFDNRPLRDAWLRSYVDTPVVEGTTAHTGAGVGPCPDPAQGRVPATVLRAAMLATWPARGRADARRVYPDATSPALASLTYVCADGRARCAWRAPDGPPGACGREYREHPAADYDGLRLHRLCDGSLVRL